MVSLFRGPITGPKFFAIFASFFIVIIGVNIVMMTQAIRTFPGLVVKNSYVASQTFDHDRTLQEALGWTVKATVESNELVVAITDAQGQPVEAKSMTGIFGRPTAVKWDQTPVMAFDGQVYRAPVDVTPGYWDYRITAVAMDGTPFQQRLEILIGE